MVTTTTTSTTSANPSQADDNMFCHQVAKRSVARAALHLGIDFMSEEALDVMGDVLLHFLGRLGQRLSLSVERSGRTSAHTNVLDAIRAATEIGTDTGTSPAVHQLHLGQQQQQMNATPSSQNVTNTAAGGPSSSPSSFSICTNSSSGGWQDLAAFCFGPDWQQQHNPSQSNSQQEQSLTKTTLSTTTTPAQQQHQPLATTATRAGGKQLPVPQQTNAGPRNSNQGGWDAPYLDDIPSFPLSSLACANPHRLVSSNVAWSLHNQPPLQENNDGNGRDITTNRNGKASDASNVAANEKEKQLVERELQGIPDDAFTCSSSPWGELQSSRIPTKRHRLELVPSSPSQGPPPSKRAKIEEPSSSANENSTTNTDNNKEKSEKEPSRETPDKHKQRPSPPQQKQYQQHKKQHQQNRPAYVPYFYPPFPQAKPASLGRAVMDVDESSFMGKTSRRAPSALAIAQEAQENGKHGGKSLGVRSSLVQLGEQGNSNYWGSGCDDGHDNDTHDVFVPFGRNNAAFSSNTKDATASTTPSSVVVPLGRASGSRVSRILEGSVDAAFS